MNRGQARRPRVAATAHPTHAVAGRVAAGAARLGVSMALVAGLIADGHAAPQACPPYVRHAPGGDYNDPADRQGLALVEFHFPPQVENLSKGVTGRLGGDIGYTLEHFPNHPRALTAMARLGLRDKSGQPVGAKYSINCYFERAIGFVPGDARPHAIYGSYLLSMGQPDTAMAQLTEALRLDPDNATANYNLGLLYLNKKDYGAARRHAQKAYALGFPLPGLRNRLSAAGQWPPEPAISAPAPSSGATAPGAAVAAPPPLDPSSNQVAPPDQSVPEPDPVPDPAH